MPRNGIRPQVGLDLRPCAACGKEFQPYRSYQIACSRSCRDRTKEQSPRLTPRHLACKRCGEGFEASWSGMGTQPHCAACTAELSRGNQERKNVARRIGNNPDRRVANMHTSLRTLYGLEPEKYYAMLEAQGGVCAICGSPPTPGVGPASMRLHVDHDHRTGKVRALLCNNCNRGLGYLRDDYELLLKAAAYLKEYRNGITS